jgi:hypothetical protein
MTQQAEIVGATLTRLRPHYGKALAASSATTTAAGERIPE